MGESPTHRHPAQKSEDKIGSWWGTPVRQKGNMGLGYLDGPRGQGRSRTMLVVLALSVVLLVGLAFYHSESLSTTFKGLSSQVRETIKASFFNDNDPAHIMIRSAHRGTRQLCDYTEPQLRGILSMPHECGWGNNRYYYGGAWMTWEALHKEFEQPAENSKPEGECMLACKYHEDYHCTKDVPCVHAFYLRKHSTDTLVLRQLYEWEEHNFLKPDFPFNAILDAGANVGIASAMFATMYPSAKIVAVEASSRNFQVLQKNVEPFPNVLPINAALWPRTAPLSLIVGPRNMDLPPEWGYMVVETSTLKDTHSVEDSLAGVSAPFLLKVLGIPSFDFVKVDIEGGEGELLATDSPEVTGWVDRAKMIAMELHGDMKPGSNVTVLDFFERRPQFLKFTDTHLVEDYCIFKRKGAFPEE